MLNCVTNLWYPLQNLVQTWRKNWTQMISNLMTLNNLVSKTGDIERFTKYLRTYKKCVFSSHLPLSAVAHWILSVGMVVYAVLLTLVLIILVIRKHQFLNRKADHDSFQGIPMQSIVHEAQITWRHWLIVIHFQKQQSAEDSVNIWMQYAFNLQCILTFGLHSCTKMIFVDTAFSDSDLEKDLWLFA